MTARPTRAAAGLRRDGRLRVVAGRFKGRRLEVPPGQDIRPTSDRARQALFDILTHRPGGLAGRHVLDGFAGTGAVGIEALSRGARHATFVDPAAAAQAAIRANLAACAATGLATVLALPLDRLGAPGAAGPADLVFLDPPYGSGLGAPALAHLGQAGWLADGWLGVVEVAAAEPFASPAGLAVVDERRYGAGRFVFVQSH